MIVYVWPDYSWCFEDDFQRLTEEDQSMSDDYIKVEIPESVTLEGIDDYLYLKRPQG